MMNYSLITFLIILGAAMIVVMGFVTARLFNKEEDSGMKDPSSQQVEYMRSVRHRYFESLEWTARSFYPCPKLKSVTQLCREASRENRHHQRTSLAA